MIEIKLSHGDEGNVQPTAGATALGLAKRAGMSVLVPIVNNSFVVGGKRWSW